MPLFETQRDVENSAKATAKICEALKISAYEVKAPAVINYCLVKQGRVIALAEIKTRFVPFSKYRSQGLFLSWRKFVHMRHLSSLMRVPAWVFYQFQDGIRQLDLGLFLRPKTVLRGRTDRGVAHDMERMILVPPTLFKTLEELDINEHRITETPEMEKRANIRAELFQRLREAADQV